MEWKWRKVCFISLEDGHRRLPIQTSFWAIMAIVSCHRNKGTLCWQQCSLANIQQLDSLYDDRIQQPGPRIWQTKDDADMRCHRRTRGRIFGSIDIDRSVCTNCPEIHVARLSRNKTSQHWTDAIRCAEKESLSRCVFASIDLCNIDECTCCRPTISSFIVLSSSLRILLIVSCMPMMGLAARLDCISQSQLLGRIAVVGLLT